jgi:hypothetical protein
MSSYPEYLPTVPVHDPVTGDFLGTAPASCADPLEWVLTWRAVHRNPEQERNREMARARALMATDRSNWTEEDLRAEKILGPEPDHKAYREVAAEELQRLVEQNRQVALTMEHAVAAQHYSDSIYRSGVIASKRFGHETPALEPSDDGFTLASPRGRCVGPARR